MRRILNFGLARFDRFPRSLFDFLSRQVRNNSLRSGWTERLGNRLLAASSTTTAPATTSASAPALTFSATALLARLPGGIPGLLTSQWRFKLRLRTVGSLILLLARLDPVRFKSFRLSIGLGDGRRRLLRIEISGLQWRRRGLASLLGSFLLAAL